MYKKLNNQILKAIKLVSQAADGYCMDCSINNESLKRNPFLKERMNVINIQIKLEKKLKQ